MSIQVSTALLVLLCSSPFIGLFVYLWTSQKRRVMQAMRDFAAILDNGIFAAGDRRRGPRATGRWKGVDVSVGFFGRRQPPVFLTTVTASRRPSPLAALLVPRSNPRGQLEQAPDDVPEWIVRMDRK